MGRVLLADDDRELLRAYDRVLARAGFDVVTADDGDSALAAIRTHPFDAIVSDIAMPGMDGLELLRAVRGHDLDVPVILMTGASALKVAHDAIAFGATRLLLKPVRPDELVGTVRRATGLYHLARLKRQALELLGADDRLLGDAAALTVRFERALSSLWMAFQPIVSLRERRLHAYEALLRSDEPALGRPELMLAAAERLGRVVELGRRVRASVARAAEQAPPGVLLFVNLRSEDLIDEQLCAARAPLSTVASRVVLEITERTSIERVPELGARVAALRRLGFGIAVDDLCAGYAGPSSLALLEPDVVKIDRSLVRDLDSQPTRSGLVASMTRLCAELGMRVVVEGVETRGERDAVIAAGGDLVQGYFVGRPARGFVPVRFDD
jgi:EAL domain-containing protein (putative c-di-GMP-specific phosphodiesterase class I)/ActR/RegA family two-component response regulator